MKIPALLATLMLSAVCLQAQKPAVKERPSPTEARLPTKAEVDTALHRIYGYDPSIQWQIFLIRKSAVPGMSEVFLKMKDEFQHLYLTADCQFAISGDAMPFGPDLYAPARKKLMAADGIFRGPEKPAVVMVEFSDLQCPHCKDAQPVLEKLASDFPQMKIIFQQYPLPKHPWAAKAARYADCAGHTNNAAAWKFIAGVYENQGGIALATADEKLKELARNSGFDAEKLSACASSPASEERIKKSVALGDSLGILGTPSIFVNGRLLEGVGVAPYEQVKAIVQYEIAHAGK